MRRAYRSSRGVLPIVVCLNECDREASILRRSWPIRGCCAMKKKVMEDKCVLCDVAT
jgi:hypothetical protein